MGVGSQSCTRYRTPILLAQTLLMATLAFAGVPPAKPGRAICAVAGRSSGGVPQVSNLELIAIECRIAVRSLPKSGVQHGLKVDAKVYRLSNTGVRTLVPSSVNESGGGGDSKLESADFYIEIPIDASERDAAIREYMSDVARSAASSADEKERERAQLYQKLSPQVLAPYFRQHRVGRFQVDCRVLDEGKVIAVGRADLEVVFKGRALDQPGFRNK